MARSEQGIINERLRNKINRKVEYELCREYGICYKCSAKCEINPKTNKTYHACKSCRERHDYLVKLRS